MINKNQIVYYDDSLFLRIIRFLETNGFKKIEKDSFVFESRCGEITIELEKDEITFLDERGDFYQIPIENHMCIYTLIGYMIVNRFIGINFNWENIGLS